MQETDELNKVVFKIFKQGVWALKILHDLGKKHNDIKPDNILANFALDKDFRKKEKLENFSSETKFVIQFIDFGEGNDM